MPPPAPLLIIDYFRRYFHTPIRHAACRRFLLMFSPLDISLPPCAAAAAIRWRRFRCCFTLRRIRHRQSREPLDSFAEISLRRYADFRRHASHYAFSCDFHASVRAAFSLITDFLFDAALMPLRGHYAAADVVTLIDVIFTLVISPRRCRAASLLPFYHATIRHGTRRYYCSIISLTLRHFSLSPLHCCRRYATEARHFRHRQTCQR